MAPKFGTSGLRGLVTEMTDLECYLHTKAFLLHAGERSSGTELGLAGDLRSSTPRILAAVSRAARDSGWTPEFCGFIPTPALCHYGLQSGIPTVMVTGSHIPDDRNGIKFNLATGEILKVDEEQISRLYRQLRSGSSESDGQFNEYGSFSTPPAALPGPSPRAAENYRKRYMTFFPPGCLSGLRAGVYDHSSVGRDLLAGMLEDLGARVVRLGRSEAFVPVDTEAIANAEELAEWVKGHQLDALVSSDGDSDRPLIVDDSGKQIHGDLLGILVAQYLGADTVVVPVSCTTAVELSGWFNNVIRTRIGSPFVIEAMLNAKLEGSPSVIGFEANGGFLTATPIGRNEAKLESLPTRDAALPLLAVLHLARTSGLSLSGLRSRLPKRFTWSGLIKQFPSEAGAAIIDLFRENPVGVAAEFFGDFGRPQRVDLTDGARIHFDGGIIVHLRPSGNAPEFRCYTEAETERQAQSLNARAVQVIRTRLASHDSTG